MRYEQQASEKNLNKFEQALNKHQEEPTQIPNDQMQEQSVVIEGKKHKDFAEYEDRMEQTRTELIKLITSLKNKIRGFFIYFFSKKNLLSSPLNVPHPFLYLVYSDSMIC